jgi:hypothetical protein
MWQIWLHGWNLWMHHGDIWFTGPLFLILLVRQKILGGAFWRWFARKKNTAWHPPTLLLTLNPIKLIPTCSFGKASLVYLSLLATRQPLTCNPRALALLISRVIDTLVVWWQIFGSIGLAHSSQWRGNGLAHPSYFKMTSMLWPWASMLATKYTH